MRRVLIITLIVVFASSALALAAWKVVDLVQGESGGSPGPEVSSTTEEGSAEASVTPGEGAQGEEEVTAADVTGEALPSGDDFAQTSPGQRYVSETQRHQNFFAALAEGRVKRLDAVATDYQPAGDPNTSYLYFTVTTTDGAKSDGTMVLKYENSLWRIASVRELQGDLEGGTNYAAPDSFEADLAREITELQEFLSKVAQGRLDYMIVDSIAYPSDSETVLTGRVVGVGGRIENTQMTLRKDYNIWHLTNIVSLGT